MYNAEYGHWDTTEHYIWYLSDEDISLLWKCGVFDLLNTKFDVMIDNYEDENIYYQRLFFHRDELFEQLSIVNCKKQINQLMEMIDKAIAAQTLLSIVL